MLTVNTPVLWRNPSAVALTHTPRPDSTKRSNDLNRGFAITLEVFDRLAGLGCFRSETIKDLCRGLKPFVFVIRTRL